ncbi:hypothetical protein MTO96_051585 [Rhipicephalus appendiculatus]
MSHSPQRVKSSEGAASSRATAPSPGSSAVRSPGTKSPRRMGSPRRVTTPARTPPRSGNRSPLASGAATPSPAHDIAGSTGALMAAFGAPGYVKSSKKAASSDGAATSPKGQVQPKTPEVASKEGPKKVAPKGAQKESPTTAKVAAMHATTTRTVTVEDTEARETTTATTAASLRVSKKPMSPSRQASVSPKAAPKAAPKAPTDHPAGSTVSRAPEDGAPKHTSGPSDQKSPKDSEAAPSGPPSPRKFPFSTGDRGLPPESKNSTAAAIRAAPELANACADRDSHAECRNVTLYMLHAMNPDARPCADFYDSVCGWWRAKNPDRRPFLEEYVATFNRRVADTLATKATIHSENSSVAQSLETQMAIFYASCFRATTGQSDTSDATAVLEAMGSETLAWMNASTFAALLDLVVSTTLRSGLSSFVRVGYSANRTFRLDSSTAWINSSTLFAIDRVVDNARSKGNGQAWSLLKGPDDLVYIAPEIDWKDALERGLPSRFSSDAQREMTVLIRAVEEIRNIVGHLRKLPPRQASMYSLTVLLAQVMKYAPYLEEQATSSVDGVSVSNCLRHTAATFGRLYPLWVARTFQSEDEVALVRELFQDITSTLRNDSKVNAGVLIDTHKLTSAQLVVYGETGGDSLPLEPLAATLGPDFLPNIATVAAARVGEGETVPDDYWLPQLRGHIGYHVDGNFLVSSTYLSRTSIFAHASLDHKVQRSARYATMGALILRSIFDSDAKYFPPWARRYVDLCFAASASSVLGRPVEPQRAKRFVRARWSAQLAWLLKSRRVVEEASENKQAASAAPHKVTREAAADQKFVQHRLFFRILCFLECGEPDGEDVCNDMVRSDRRFLEAFHCDAGSAEWPGSCDCRGMDRCETHFPAS